MQLNFAMERKESGRIDVKKILKRRKDCEESKIVI